MPPMSWRRPRNGAQAQKKPAAGPVSWYATNSSEAAVPRLKLLRGRQEARGIFKLEGYRANKASRKRAQGRSAASLRPSARGKSIFLGDEKLYVRGVTYGTFSPDEDD